MCISTFWETAVIPAFPFDSDGSGECSSLEYNMSKKPQMFYLGLTETFNPPSKCLSASKPKEKKKVKGNL